MPGLQKICLIFSHKPNKFTFLCVIMGMGKSNNKKKEGTMSYVIMFGYGRGVAHSNAHTWVGLTVCF
jgi:hypothetical protein